MKRKELMDRKVIKAMSIGLATMVAVSSMPVGVLADEAEVSDLTDSGTNNSAVDCTDESYSDSIKDASEAMQETSDNAENMTNAVETVTQDINDNVKPEDNAGTSEMKDENGVNKTNVQVVIDAGNDVKDELEKVNNQVTATEESVSDSKKIDVAETEVATSVVEKVDSATTTAEEVSTYMSDAIEKADSLVDNINNASSADDAQKAYDELNTLTEEAANKVTEANNELAKIENEYNNAKQSLRNAKKSYDEAVKTSYEAAAKLKENIETLEKKIKTLESDVKAAKKEVDSCNSSALSIIKAQEKVNNGGGYRAADSLFKAIMEGYYIKNIVPGAEDIKVYDWTWQTYDYDYNYCKVTYKVDGKEVTEYYNYKYEADTTKSLEIFKKSEAEVGVAKYIEEKYTDQSTNKLNTNEAKKAAESKVYSYTENGKTKYITGMELGTISENAIIQNSTYKNNSSELKVSDNEDFAAFLDGDTEAAKTLKAEMEKADKANAWVALDGVFKSILINYYIPGVAEGATNITVHDFTKYGYNNDEYNYCKVTYKVGDEEKTEYYNYKAADKKSNSMVIFKKSVEEVGAADYIAEKYTDPETNKIDTTAAFNAAKTGVYTYIVNGKTQYITGLEKKELENKAEVVQNATYKNRSSEFVQSTNEKFNTFVNTSNELTSKYNRILAETQAAKKEIEKEVESAGKLTEKVSNLENQNNKIIVALNKKNVSVAEYLGIAELENSGLEIIEGEELSDLIKMSLDDAISYLDAKMQKARNKYQLASEYFESLKGKRDKAQNGLDDVIRRFEAESADNDEASDESAEASGESSTSDATPTVAIATSPSGLVSTFPTAGVAGARTEAPSKGFNKLTKNVVGDEKSDKETSSLEKNADNTKETVSEVTPSEDNVVTLKDEEIPLSSMPFDSEKSEMNYWWLLVISLLGPAGYALYRKIGKKEEV